MDTNKKFPALLLLAWLIAAGACIALYAAAVLRPEILAPFTGPAQAGKAAQASVQAQASAKPEAAKTGQDQETGDGRDLPTAIPPFDPQNGQYVLLAWSDSGMRLLSDADAFLSIKAPGSTLRAQLVKRGESPEIVTIGVNLTYAVERPFARPSAHVRFWDFSAPLTGQTLPPDTGPAGFKTEGTMVPDAKAGMFMAEGLPVVPYADLDSEPGRELGSFMPYPAVSVEAHDAATGALLASTKAVLPVSTELGCRGCHGGSWLRGPAGMSDDTAKNILAAHDRLSHTTLLADAQAGKPKACASCHADGKDSGAMGLSASVHGFHASFLTDKASAGQAACVSCHPASPHGATRFLRDHHAAQGLDCVRCHGTMTSHALGLLKAEEAAGRADAAERLMAPIAPKGGTDVAPRTAWVMEPDCASCHDFSQRPDPRTASADGRWTKDGASLFHARKDEAGFMACAACHGPAHATYPARNPFGRDRDNIQPVQYQAYAAPLGAGNHCSVCHVVDMDAASSAHHAIPQVPTVRIAVPEGAELRRPRVMFPHAAHGDMECKTCHHKGYVQAQGQSCAVKDCHDHAKPQGDSDSADPRYFRNAFHGRDFSCNACHQARRKAGQPSGPVECAGCHTASQAPQQQQQQQQQEQEQEASGGRGE